MRRDTRTTADRRSTAPAVGAGTRGTGRGARNGRLWRVAAVACTVAVVAGGLAAPGRARAEGPAPGWASCSEQRVPVTLGPSDPTVYQVAGQLCVRGDTAVGRTTVELMISGLTYDRNYFNLPYYPETYSAVYAATLRGYSTFVIDRLGLGLSGRPPADRLTVQAHAHGVEQIVRALRAGAIGGVAFDTVVGIGHSLGAGILQYLAGTVVDRAGVPDYLVLSGWLHVGSGPALATLATSLYEASADRRFYGAGLPTGYLTTMPETRGENFYHAAGAEAVMVSIDEALKQTGTLAERQTLAEIRASAVTLNIRVPVLLSVGRYDSLQCNESAGLSCASAAAVLAREARSYGARACLGAVVIPATGHSVSLHLRARESYDLAHAWLERYLGGTGVRDANGCVAG